MDKEEPAHTPTSLSTPTTLTITETPKSSTTQSFTLTTQQPELTTLSTTSGTTVVTKDTPTAASPTPTTALTLTIAPPTPTSQTTPTTPVLCTSDGHLVFPLPLIEGLDSTPSTTASPSPTPSQTQQTTPCPPTPLQTSQTTPTSQSTPLQTLQTTPIQANQNTPSQTPQTTPTNTPIPTPSPSPRPHVLRRPVPRRPAPQPPTRPGPPTTPVPRITPTNQNPFPSPKSPSVTRSEEHCLTSSAHHTQPQARTSAPQAIQTQAQVHVSASTTGPDFSIGSLSLRLIDDDMSSDDGSGRLSDYFDERIVFPPRPSPPHALERIVLTKPSPLTPTHPHTHPEPNHTPQHSIPHSYTPQALDTELARDRREHREHRALTHSFSDPGLRRRAVMSPSSLQSLEEEEWDGLSGTGDYELYGRGDISRVGRVGRNPMSELNARGDFGRVSEGGIYRLGRVGFSPVSPCQTLSDKDIYGHGRDRVGRMNMPPLPPTQTLADRRDIRYDSPPCQTVAGYPDKHGGRQGITDRVHMPPLPSQALVDRRDISYDSPPCQPVQGTPGKQGPGRQGMTGRAHMPPLPPTQNLVEREGKVERGKAIPLSRSNSAIGLPEDLMAPRPSLTGIAALALMGAALMPGTAMLLHSLFRLVFGTLFPAYYSYKAVKTKNVKEYVKWMMYWIVFAFFTCLETLTDIFLSFWFPFYYELKILVVLWLLSPATRGSSILYRKFVHPWLTRREEDIDNCIAQAKQQGYSAVLSLGSKGVNYATTVIMNTAIKGGGGLMNQLKRSYSSGELISDDGDMNRNIKPLPPHHQDYDDPHIRQGTPPHLHLPPTPPTYPETPSTHDLNAQVQSYYPEPPLPAPTSPSPSYPPSPPLTRRRRRELLEERRLEEERREEVEVMEK